MKHRAVGNTLEHVSLLSTISQTRTEQRDTAVGSSLNSMFLTQRIPRSSLLPRSLSPTSNRLQFALRSQRSTGSRLRKPVCRYLYQYRCIQMKTVDGEVAVAPSRPAPPDSRERTPDAAVTRSKEPPHSIYIRERRLAPRLKPIPPVLYCFQKTADAVKEVQEAKEKRFAAIVEEVSNAFHLPLEQ